MLLGIHRLGWNCILRTQEKRRTVMWPTVPGLSFTWHDFLDSCLLKYAIASEVQVDLVNLAQTQMWSYVRLQEYFSYPKVGLPILFLWHVALCSICTITNGFNTSRSFCSVASHRESSLRASTSVDDGRLGSLSMLSQLMASSFFKFLKNPTLCRLDTGV